MLLDVILDALVDSAKLLPFLFLTYLFMEWLEHGAGDKFEQMVARAGKAGPAIGAVLGIIPQCGFCGAAATLYAGRVVTLGTLVSVFLVTSDEMLPIMFSQAVNPLVIGKILLIKLIVGMAVGFVLDAILRGLGREHIGLSSPRMHAGHHGNDIHELCELEGCECADGCDCENCEHRAAEEHSHNHEHECACEHDHEHEHVAAAEHEHAHECDCEHEHSHDHGHDHAHHHGASLSHLAGAALKHSLQITVFVFIICLILNLVVEAGLEDAIAVIAATPFVGSAVCGVLGLIPNCAISVALTQLYLDGVLTGGAMMSGLLVNAGVGLIVLLRTNSDSRENLRICGVLLAVGIICGLLIEATAIL